MSDKREQYRASRADSGYAPAPIPHRLPIYSELDHAAKEARFMTVEPGSGEEPIRCRLTPVSLLQTHLPSYETISYVWGDASLRGSVIVHDQVLDVPFSTERVLRRMRHEQQARVLWIDSICINQKDKNDCNYQVALMCDIYSRATQCLVWIGEDDEGSIGQTFRELCDVYEEARARTDDFRTFKETVWPGWWSVYGEASQVTVDYQAMAQLFYRPWFSRLWVVQEVALSQRSICHCGPYTISMDHLLKAAVWLWNKSKTTPSALTGHLGLARAVHVASYSDPLFAADFRLGTKLQWMLHTLRQYDTSRDVDHVYGILGMYQKFLLGPQPLPARMLPDYDRSVQEVMSDVAKLAIEESNNLAILIYVSHRSSAEVESIGMPSWVPKYHRKQDLVVDHLPFNFKGLAASGGTTWNIELGRDTALEQLRVSGFCMGSVVEVTDAFELDALSDHGRLLSLMRAAREMSNHSRAAHSSAALEQTLVAGHDHKRTVIGPVRSAMGFEAVLHHLQTTNTVPSIHQVQEDDKPDQCSAGAYHEALTRWTRNRRLFRTDTGYLGLGPRMLQPGDTMTILYGAPVPMALRARKDRAGFAYVGDIYVDGIMSGEAVRDHKAAGRQNDHFLLV